jgi:hypothetical protein
VNETSKSIVGNAAVKIGAKNLFPPSNHQQQRDTVAPHQPSKVNQSAVEEEEDDDDGDRPHFRNNCPNQPFVAMPFLVIREHQDNQDVCHIPHCMSRGAETNIATCSMCYCYVCNKPAKECRVRYYQNNIMRNILHGIAVFAEGISHLHFFPTAMVFNNNDYKVYHRIP